MPVHHGDIFFLVKWMRKKASSWAGNVQLWLIIFAFAGNVPIIPNHWFNPINRCHEPPLGLHVCIGDVG